MNMKKRRITVNSDTVFDTVNTLLMVILLFVFVWPLWFVIIASFSDPSQVWAGNVLLLPKDITLISYEELIAYKQIWTGYANSIFYTVTGTALNMVLTVCCAFPLSRKNFPPRKLLLVLVMFTMYFNGGIIPTYMMMRKVGILNTRWAMIVPGAISVYNMLVVRSYFINSIPKELEEAAIIDGANLAQYLWKIVLPLSKPVLAVVGLYYAVAHWNDFYNALLYLNDAAMKPLQSILRELLTSSQMLADQISSGVDAASLLEKKNLAETMKYSMIIVSVIPMMCVYPFVQKHFVKGVMVGSIKG